MTARTLELKDPGLVVVDEVIGQWIALAGARTLNWKSYAGGVRAVPPVRYLEAGAGAPAGSAAGRARASMPTM